MNYTAKNKYGTVEIYDDVIASMAGLAASECYGVKGLSSKMYIRDGLNELLGIDNFKKGIVISSKNDVYTIDIYVILAQNIRVVEVTNVIQTRVKYELSQKLGIEVEKVNIYIKDVRA